MKKAIYMGYYTNDATWYYRMSVLSAIKHPDLIIEQKPYTGEVTWSFFMGYDILILERPSSDYDLSLIKLAKQVGLKIVCDYDDDCLHVPATNPMWHHYKECRKVFMECMALADEVWVSTAPVKEAFRMLNSNIHIIPNAHNDYLFPVEQKRSYNVDTKKAFWRGGGSHEADVYSEADNLVSTINGNMDWHFYFLGFRFIYMELQCGLNYTPVSNMPLMQYFVFMNTERPNLVFHPLEDNVFNRGKSNIAWLEGTYAGAAFFGNKALPEFDKAGIYPIELLAEGLNYTSLMVGNEESWQYILENLLLSNINKIRVERLLAI